MVITQLNFLEFYERFRQFTRYHVLITLVARVADAPEEYDEILKFWSSLHDVTGEHVAFVFAGHPEPTQKKFAWWTNNRMEAIPDGLLIQNPSELNLEEVTAKRPYYLSPEVPLDINLKNSHSLHIREIKSALNLREEQIPCFHLLFTHSNTSRIIPLSKLSSGVYQFIRELVINWDRLFKMFFEKQHKAQAIYSQNIKVNANSNRSIGEAKSLLRQLRSVASDQTNEDLKNRLEDFLNIVSDMDDSPDLRKEAFSMVKNIKQIHPDVSNQFLSNLNTMIDRAPHLNKIVTTEPIHDSNLYYELDNNLSLAINNIIPPDMTDFENTDNSGNQPLKAFISYSKFDGESNTSGINLLEEFKKALVPLSLYNNLIQTWDDTMLIAGEDWDNKIRGELEGSDIIFLLVSNNFLNTRYIKDVEIATAIKRHDAGECIVVPVILSTCGWADIPILANLNAIPRKGHNIASWKRNSDWSTMDDAWHQVFTQIKNLIINFHSKKSAQKQS